jgi:hypothetical protein
MNSIPDRITAWLQPAAKSILKFKQVRNSHFSPHLLRTVLYQPNTEDRITGISLRELSKAKK